MPPYHPIFDDIDRGDLEGVQQRVLADPLVLEELHGTWTPLILAIWQQKPALALWLIENRGQHDVNTRDLEGATALHYACFDGPLPVVQALVGAGADLAAMTNNRATPLIHASILGHREILAYIVKLPAVKAIIDAVTSIQGNTALSIASRDGKHSIVQLLLDAGADPTTPAGLKSPLNQATTRGHTAIAALLCTAIAEPDRARTLHKARSLLDAPRVISKAAQDAQDKRLLVTEQQQSILAVTPAYLKSRVAWGKALPQVDLTPHEGEEHLRATAAFVLGLEEDGVEYKGLPQDLFMELLGYMLPAWADQGPAAGAEA